MRLSTHLDNCNLYLKKESLLYDNLRLLILLFSAKMGSYIVSRASDSGISREHDEPVRQRSSHSAAASVRPVAQGSQADLGRLHWLSEHRQVVSDKHAQEEESVQRGAHCRRDQSVAVHHTHETNLLDRLSRCRLSAWRLRNRYCPKRCRASREHTIA